MKMRLFHILVLAICLWTCVQAAVDNAALAECGNLHKLEFHNIPNAEAVYSNSNCNLKCAVGEKVLSNDALNEGFACPLNANGICHSGQCVESGHANNDAVRECANLHHIDFLKQRNTGTLFTESQCFLKCVLNGNTISSNSMNEGFPCPDNHNGVCRSGHCVIGTVNQPTTTSPAVTVAPTTSNPKSNRIINQFNVQIVEAQLFNNTSYKELLGAVCVEPNNYPIHFQHCQTGSCLTPPIHQVTSKPTWAHNCLLNGHFLEKDFVTVGLYEHNNGVYHDLGFYTEEFHSLATKYESKIQNSHLVFQNNFPINDKTGKWIGDFSLIFNLTLSNQ